MNRLRLLFLSTRPMFFPAIVLPILIGASTAWYTHRVFDGWYFILTLVAGVLYHGGMNVLNDYFDHLNGTDDINRGALHPYTGGSGMIQKGFMSPGEVLSFAIVLLGLGSLAGLYLAVERGYVLLIIGLVGLLSGIFYSAPPVFLAGRGLGEVTVGMNFGLFTVLGSYFVQTGSITMEAVFASLPISFLVSALLYINEFPDYEADRISGKHTIVVRLGPKRGRWGMVFLVLMAYISVIAGIVAGYLPMLSILSVLSFGFALSSTVGLIKNYHGGPGLVPSIRSIILAHLSSGFFILVSHILTPALT